MKSPSFIKYLFLFFVLASFALIWIICSYYSEPQPSSQQEQYQGKPYNNNDKTNPKIFQENGKQKGDGGTDKQEHNNNCSNYWNKIVMWITGNDRVITAISTAVIAAFTITLFFATWLLWLSNKRHSERQLRAYLSVYPDYLGFNPTIPVKTIPVHIRYPILNHGQTPAYNVTNSALLEILPYPLPDNYQLPTVPTPPNTTAVLHPTATFNGCRVTNTFSKNEISQIINNDDFRIYIFGFVTYKDAFDKHRQTKFCWSVIRDKHLALIGQSVLTLTEKTKGDIPENLSLHFEPCNQHNEAD